MDLATVTAITKELEAELVGKRLGKIFQLSKTDLAVDLRLPRSRYLFISLQPGNPRTYLITRRLRDLEKASVNPSTFALIVRKRLSGAEVISVAQLPAERVVLVGLSSEDDLGNAAAYDLVLQLTGTSANLFLLDLDGLIVESLKPARGTGQQIGERYRPPERRDGGAPLPARDAPPIENLSATLDADDQERAVADRFRTLASTARAKIRREISKRKKLLEKLQADLTGHGDAERWKRYGDLLLANVSTSKRDGGKAIVMDYFDPSASEIEIEVDENDSLTDAAEKYFRRYTKARNAAREIELRREQIERELNGLESEALKLEDVIAGGDEDELLRFTGADKRPKETAKRKKAEAMPGVRTFVSSDGIEILVGKKAKDNDFLTFRIAKSLDTWMHAADYPGSHVVIRNPSRKDIPPRTLVEAAQLAAFYSQGKTQPKAAVHYTQKKFVNKPKGAMAGLVSLASFKTLLVEPKIGEATLKAD